MYTSVLYDSYMLLLQEFSVHLKLYLSLQAPPGPIPPDKDVIPLCCCKINGACFKKLGSSVTYCQALDSVDGKVRTGCILITF